MRFILAAGWILGIGMCKFRAFFFKEGGEKGQGLRSWRLDTWRRHWKDNGNEGIGDEWDVVSQ